MCDQHVAVWRGRGALFWSSAVLPLCCLFVLAVTSINIANPYTWLIYVLSNLVSLKKWAYLMSICAIHWMLVSQRIQFFSVSPEVRRSQWSIFQCVLQPRRLLHIFCHVFGSGFICWCLLKVIDGSYQDFSKACPNNQELSCLNEQHIFIILHAMYLGMLGSMVFFCNNQNLIRYPVIQQSKWDQIRGEILSVLVSCACFVLSKLKYYYLFYYLIIGHAFKYGILSYLPVHINTEDQLDTILGLIDLWLFLTTWAVGTLLYFFTSIFSVMNTAYQTQPYEFVVQSNIEPDENRKLVDALACDTYPLLQFQGYQDLCLMAKNSSQRRAQLFSLSTLGGHPYNWLSISAECLASLSKFCEDVRGHNSKTMLNGSVKHVSGDSLLKTSTGECLIKKESICDKIYRELGKRKVLAQVLKPSPECSSRQLLSHAQKYIWNIEALSHLVTASYKEDTYGVVQKSLPEIISTLVTLQEEIEKLIKLASTVTRIGSESDQENALHIRLRVTLKSAIYNVGCVFGQHVESISVSQEVKKRLRQFTDYKI